jgi:hypothetical protein
MKSCQHFCELCSLLLLIAFAQATAAQDRTASEDAPKNVAQIIDFKDQAEEFKNAADELAEGRRRLQAPHACFATLQNAKATYDKNPRDTQARANYALAYAKSLEVIHQRLEDFIAKREEFEKHYESYKHTAQAKISALERERETLDAAKTEYAEVLAQGQQFLQQSKTKYASVIRSGQKLPPEVNHMVTRTALEMKAADRNAKLYGSYITDAQRRIANAGRSLESTERFYERVDLCLLTAEHDLETIGILATMASAKIESPLPRFDSQLTNLDPLQSSLPDLLIDDALRDLGEEEVEQEEVVRLAEKQAGTRILQELLSADQSNELTHK